MDKTLYNYALASKNKQFPHSINTCVLFPIRCWNLATACEETGALPVILHAWGWDGARRMQGLRKLQVGSIAAPLVHVNLWDTIGTRPELSQPCHALPLPLLLECCSWTATVEMWMILAAPHPRLIMYIYSAVYDMQFPIFLKYPTNMWYISKL